MFVMPELEEIAENLTAKQRAQERRKFLLWLISQILSGNLSTKQEPISSLFQADRSVRDSMLHGPRSHYISPLDRSSYNYGYMKLDEMEAGTPNIW